MENPLVSVIINNYNYEKYLGAAIDSVLKQTYQNWELIIVDDGSTDHSEKIIADYKDKYPARIEAVMKENGGQASALNAGFACAKGKLVCFLDSDDLFYETKLERIVQQCPESGFLLHGFRYSNGNEKAPYYKTRGETTSFFEKLLARGNIWPTSQIVFSREILEKILPMPEERFRISADSYLMFMCARYCEPTILKEELGLYRIHEKNAWYGFATKRMADKLFSSIIEEVNRDLKARQKAPIRDLWPYIRKTSVEQDGYAIEAGRSYVIYGTGGGGERLKNYVEYCGGRVITFLDSDSRKWGTMYLGIPICSMKDLKKKKRTYDRILIGSVDYKDEISAALSEQGYKKYRDFIYLEVVLNSYSIRTAKEDARERGTI